MRVLAGLLLMGWWLAGCQVQEHEQEQPLDVDRLVLPAEADGPRPHQIGPAELTEFPGRLAEGRPDDEPFVPVPVADARPLDEAAIERLLGRLEPLPVDQDDAQEFALRPGSQPPPRAGETALGEFPSAEDRALPRIDTPSGPLQVLRFAPEGEVPIAGQISITFDRPMVAVTAHEDASAAVPVSVEPSVPGQWRWVGTRTLLFEPESARLPMATEFRVVVDEDLTAPDGATLAEPVAWQFSTPSLALVRMLPEGNSVPLEPVIVLAFDQRVLLDELQPYLSLSTGANENLAWRAASDEEIEADSGARRLVADLEPGRWVALRPEIALLPSSAVTVMLAAGAPSAEGPRPSALPQRQSFRTYGPLQVRGHACGWAMHCQPGDPIRFNFNHALATGQRMSELVSVEPVIDGMTVDYQGHQISIGGFKRGRTGYRVVLSDRILDEFGQALSGLREFEFETDNARPQIFTDIPLLTTLDPKALPLLDFYSINYRDVSVTVHRVEPSDWPDYQPLARGDWRYRDQEPELPGERLFQGLIAIEDQIDAVVHSQIDLSDYLDEGLGHLLVLISPGRRQVDMPEPHRRFSVLGWIQSTRIGLDAAADAGELLVWATALEDGQALPEAEVSLSGEDSSQLSDIEGLVRIALPEPEGRSEATQWLTARLGNDRALLPESVYGWGSSNWRRQSDADDLAWHVFDDRRMYRPGERVHVQGFVRRLERRPDGGIGLLDTPARLDWTVSDSRGNELTEGSGTLSTLGGFDLAFDLPDTPNLGQASVRINLRGNEGLQTQSYHHQFEIQEFRTPEFEVRTRLPAGPFVGDETINAEVRAAYYAGGALPGADLRWDVQAEPGQYRPPGHDRWSFGFEPVWWMPRFFMSHETGATTHFESRTDAAGEHGLAINLDFTNQPRPLLVTAVATVMDVNRQAWSASSEVLLHAARDYVGLKTDTYFTELGQDIVVDVLTVDLDGEIRPNRPVVIEALRRSWQHRHDRNADGDSEPEDLLQCRLTTDAEGSGQCRFRPDRGGAWELTAQTRDEAGRANASRVQRWVGGARMPAADRVEIEDLLLIPDQDGHAPGDVARLLVQAPFDSGEGLLTLRRHGLAEQRRFSLENGTATLEIRMRKEWLPNIHAHVLVAGQAERAGAEGLPMRPAIAVGEHDFSLSTAERTLHLELVPASDALAPGESTDVLIEVKDAQGNPLAGAEIALIAVDEAILALTGYEVADPMQVFYQPRPPAVRDYHLRPTLRLAADPSQWFDETVEVAPEYSRLQSIGEQTLTMEIGVGMSPPSAADAAAEKAADEPISVREDFNPLAAFVPGLITDEDGRATARIGLPDNLTRYRLTAIAVDGPARFGKAEANLTARLPLMLRPSPPRFLNFGDRFEFPLVVQNQTDQMLAVEVAMATANLDLPEGQGFVFEVPANDRRELRIPAQTRSAGQARFQIAAASGSMADAARGSLPVWTPATTEAFASYGVIDDGALRQPVWMPNEVWPQFGQLEITTTSTALHSLTDAFLYLHDYPFACSEQIASRMIAVAALRDVLSAFAVADMPGAEDIDRSMAADIERLRGMQNPDGGFGLWRRGQESWPYASLHVAHALVRAGQKDYPVPSELFDNTLDHVRNIERHIPASYGAWTRRHIVAYSLYVRGLTGDVDRTRARALIAEVDDLDQLSLESIGWLLGVLTGDEESADELARLRRFLNNRVTETAASAQFVSGWRDGAHLVMHSSRRADGVILEALIDDQPESDLVPKLVHGLQAHRVRGRWGNTQENSFVLLALDKYFRRYEGIEPDFIARAWLGEDFAGEHPFRGRTTERHHIDIPMQWLARDDGRHDLVLAKDGEGRLYYRVGLSYAPRSLELEAASHGFEVQRVYRAVDDDDDVRLRDDGVWEIRAGARVEIELTLVAPATRYHVALIDPLPAGLETINPDLAVSQPPPPAAGRQAPAHGRFWWWGPWYQHQNLRDERAEAFTSFLPGGVYHYRYTARATTPGQFVVPPARAEEMYQPETFGRTATTRVEVVP